MAGVLLSFALFFWQRYKLAQSIQTTAGNDHMDVKVRMELLGPGVENSNNARHCAQEFSVLAQINDCPGSALEKSAKKLFLVGND